jgi:hypothetical protein
MPKTAMQQLIEYLDPIHSAIIDKANELLVIEKEQIVNAWIATDNELQRIAAEQYYNETYNK